MLSGAPKRTKVRATFNLPYDLIEEARDTVVALAGPPRRLTLAKLVETALRAELDRLRAERVGRGDPHDPVRHGPRRGGRLLRGGFVLRPRRRGDLRLLVLRGDGRQDAQDEQQGGGAAGHGGRGLRDGADCADRTAGAVW